MVNLQTIQNIVKHIRKRSICLKSTIEFFLELSLIQNSQLIEILLFSTFKVFKVLKYLSYYLECCGLLHWIGFGKLSGCWITLYRKIVVMEKLVASSQSSPIDPC